MRTFLKRSISTIFVLLLMITTLPLCRAAEENQLSSGTWENPLYPDTAATDTSSFETDGIALAAEPVYVSLQEAAAQLREGLRQRRSAITVYIKTFYAPSGSFAYDLLKTAWEHTGQGDEGDYIRFAMTGCSYQTNHYISDGDYFITVTFTPRWLSTAAQEAEVDAAVAALLPQLNLDSASEYEKIHSVYDYVCENVAYDHEFAADPDSTLKHTAYAALIQKKAVCQGFATLLYRLLLEVGIDCRVITGYADDEYHGWNIVKLEGLYYNVDATWDRGLSNYYRYFLCSELNFSNHARDSEYTSSAFNAKYPMAQTSYIVQAQAGGSFGNGMTWTLNSDTGCLTVTGRGVIPDYRFSDPPWWEYKDSVRSIVLSEGITEVGEQAFEWCRNATSVTLPDSLIAIREYGFNNLRALPAITLPPNLKILEHCAFSECPALQEIVLPDSVTTVGSSVFSNCPGLKRAVLSAGMTHIPNSMFFNDPGLQEVVIPDSVTSIGDTAFRSCTSLRNITIPAHLTSLGSAALTGCSAMTNIFVEDGNPVYKDIDGVLYSADGKTLICFPAGRTGTYAVPEGTEILGSSSFGNADGMTEVTFPESLRCIEDYVFSWCYKLQRVTLGENITFVGDSAFRSCTALKSVTFLNPDTQLDSSCFAGCKALTYLKLPENLTEIPYGLMYGSSALTTLDFPAGITKIGSSAYLDCDSLINVTIPGHIKIVDRQAFDFCNRLRTITLESGVQRLENYCIRNAPQLTKAVIPPSVTYIGEENFDFCPNVTIWGEMGSAAERYAKSHGIPFVDTHTHNYSASHVVPPTCTQQGYTVFSCSCGLSYHTDYTDSLGEHIEVTFSGFPPTCTDYGLTDGKMCDRCGEITVWQSDIPPTGHSWDAGVISGEWRIYTCWDCGETEWEFLPGAYVSGSITAFHDGAAVSLGSEYETIAGNGMYDFPWVPPGTYDLTVTLPGYLTYFILGVSVGAETLVLPHIELIAGDINGDDLINAQDITLMRQNFNKAGSAIPDISADFNNDNMVNTMDLAIFRRNFGKSTQEHCTIFY